MNNGAGIGMDCVLVKRDGCALSVSILASSAFSFLISASFLLNLGPPNTIVDHRSEINIQFRDYVLQI